MPNMNITSVQLKQALPLCQHPELWAPLLTQAFARYEINTPMRAASFLSQVGHESAQFNRLEEGLNYSTAARLQSIFGKKRFPTLEFASNYLKAPQKLANYVYANRLGNGSTASGDGWTYRGRGLIQVTGRSNYIAVGKALNIDAVGQPDLLLNPSHAAMSAAWFWSNKGLNALADDRTDDDDLEDFRSITRLVNGGETDIQLRLALYHQIENLLG